MNNALTARDAHWIISHNMPVYAVAHARACVRGDSTVDADLKRLEEKVDSSGNFTVTSVALNTDAWRRDEENGGVYTVIPVTGVTVHTVPLIFINDDDTEKALQCGMSSKCESDDGTITLHASITPTDIIRITIFAMFSQDTEVAPNEPIDTEVPISGRYKLPIASADTLGGVKIGKNLDITEDGTISAKAGCSHVLSGGTTDEHHCTEQSLAGMLADTEEVIDALENALGIEDTDDDATDPPVIDP